MFTFQGAAGLQGLFTQFHRAGKVSAAFVAAPAFQPHAKGLGAVWTTVFPANADAVRKILGLPDTVVPFSCIPLGRPAGPPPPTGSRFDETKVHRQAWGAR